MCDIRCVHVITVCSLSLLQAEVTIAMESASKEQAANDIERSPSPKAGSHQKMR